MTIIVERRAPTTPETNHGDIMTLKIVGGVICINLFDTNQLNMKYATVPTMKPKIAKVVKIFVLPKAIIYGSLKAMGLILVQ